MFEKVIEQQLDQLLKGNELSEVKELNKVIQSRCKDEVEYVKYKLSATALPMYFTGDLESNIVFVELNPGPGAGLLDTKITDNKIEMFKFECDEVIKIKSYDDYMNFYRNFGKHKIEHQKNKNQKIKTFDQKQLNFFKGFGLFDLEKKEHFDYDDMLRVRDSKLQLEIVPYMSESFDFNKIPREYLSSRLKSLIDIIESKKREFIFITGSDKDIPNLFNDMKVNPYKINGYKNNVNIGVGKIGETHVIYLKSFKAQGFNGSPMINYGRLAKSIVNDIF